MVYKLNRGLYGLKPAGELWHVEISKTLKSLGYEKNHIFHQLSLKRKIIKFIHLVLRCPELKYVNDQGDKVIYVLVDKIIKRCMPEDEHLIGLVESRMMHECRLDR